MYTYQQQTKDVLDYDVIMDDWFAEIPGDDIQSVTITVTSVTGLDLALVVGPVPHPEYVLMGATPTRFKVWIGGGTEFEDYIVTCLVKTEQDRTFEVEFKIKVRNK